VRIAYPEIEVHSQNAQPTHPEPNAIRKARPVDLGLYALSRGEVQMVEAITRLVQKGGLRDA
jgi:hypothetical protein